MACDYPITIKNPKNGEYIPVPCRKCPPCLASRTNSWVFRMMQEYKEHERAYFVTLTYDTQYVPLTPKGYMSLDKSDLQKFFKRLRKIISLSHQSVVKYYACGEYGSRTLRPHYHIILYGANYEDIERAWCLDGKPLGRIDVQPLSQANVAYTAKYINKGKIIPMHENDDRVPNFSLFHKNSESITLRLKLHNIIQKIIKNGRTLP